MEELNRFYKNNYALCKALESWLARNNKSFTLSTALAAIYTFCNGNKNMMVDVIKQFKESMKRKVQGRTQVYNEGSNGIDIIKDPNGSGQLTVVGYAPERETPLAGQHRVEDPTKTKSGATNKTVLRSKEKLDQIGRRLREIFPGKNVEYLKNVELAIYRFAKEKKISQMRVVNGLASGKYKVTFDNQIRRVTVIDEGRVVYITEDAARDFRKAMRMTEYKFYSNIKHFLHDLLVDPVNASVPMLLQMYGYDRNSILKLLMDNNVVVKKQKIVDKGKDGEPIKPVMRVKYSVPKKGFDNKLKRIYIREFESNIGQLNEEGEGGGAMGGDGGANGCDGNCPSGSTTTFTTGDYQFIQPFGIIQQAGYMQQRKKKKKEIDETTATTNVGNYTYDAPAFIDAETADRKGGKNHSLSINFEDDF